MVWKLSRRIRAFEPQILVVGHRTGWRAVNVLTAALGDCVGAPEALENATCSSKCFRNFQ